MATTLKTKLQIDAEGNARAEVEALATDLEKMADKGDEAAPAFKELAAQLRALGQQQGLIDQFSKLKDTTASYAEEAKNAQAATKASALALKESQSELAASAAAEKALAESLAQARAQHEQIGQVIKGGKDELRELGAAAKAAGDDTGAYADRMKEVKAQLAEMKVTYAESGRQVKQLATEQKQAADATRQMGNDVKAAQAAFERNRQTAAAANRAYDESRVTLQKTRDALSAAGVATNDLAAAQVRVRRELDQSRQSAKALGDEHVRAAKQAEQAAAQQVAAHRKLSEKVQSISKELALVRNGYLMLQAAMSGASAIGGVIQTADAYGQMAERIRMATKSQEEYDLVQGRLLESANVTYRRLSEQQEMYIRSADALKSLGYSTQETLDITDSFTYLLATNAASAEKGAAAIDAYTKAVQSGRVESDAWQTILSATPTIVDAIAKSAGKTASEIRAMGIAGQLSVTDLNEGLRKTVEQNKAATEGMVTTVNDAVTRLTNTWSVYVGESNRANGSTLQIVKAINLLSDNLDTVVNTAMTAGKVMAAVWGARTLQALATYVVALKTASVATTALTAESLKAASAADKLGMAGKAAAAAWTGWQIGTYLQEEFDIVRRAGVLMAADLHEVAVRAQAAWEMVKGRFTDEAIQAAQEKMRQQLAELKAGYDDLLVSGSKHEQQQKKSAQATGEAAGAAGNAVTKWAELGTAYKKVTEELEHQDAAMEARNKLRAAEASAAVTLAQALGTEAEQRAAAMQAAIVEATNAERVAQQRQIEVNVLIAKRDALLALGEEVRKANPQKQDELDDLNREIGLRQKTADAALAQAGAAKVTAAAAQAEVEALKDNSARVTELAANYRDAIEALAAMREAYAQGKASAEQLAKAELAAVTASRMYGDAVSDQVRKIELRSKAEQADYDLQAAGLKVAIEQRRSIEEAARARGDEAAAIRAAAEQKRLELELATLMASAKRAEAEAVLAAIAAKKKEAETKGDKEEQQRLAAEEKAAQAKLMVAQAAENAAAKTQALAAAQKNATKDAEDYGTKLEWLKDVSEQTAFVIEKTWLSGRAQASKYREEAAKYADELEGQWQSMSGQMILSWHQWNEAVNEHFRILTQLSDDYVKRLESIDERQQALNDANGGAARSVDALRMRLIELNGTEDEIAQARRAREEAEVRRQIELQKLEIERATIRGDVSSIDRFQKEIDLLNEQLQLIGQVADAEKKKAQRSKQDNGSGGSAGGAGGGIGGGGGITTERTVNNSPTFNVYGITDPKEFARKIQPELKKLDALAR